MEGGIQGLVIVFSACMIQVLVFGNYACIGIYTVYLLEEFNGNTVSVSLISSVHFAVLLGCGPLVSFLMTKMSYRKLSIFGALLVFIGIAGTTLFMSLPAMYLFFGVFAGLGGGFIYLPSHVLSGLYYDKYQSLSTGVATSGTGLGAIVMPIIVTNLIEEYSWRGSLMILAGLDLHLLVFALLMVPPPIPASMKQSLIFLNYTLLEIDSKNTLIYHATSSPTEENWSCPNAAHPSVNHDVILHQTDSLRDTNKKRISSDDVDHKPISRNVSKSGERQFRLQSRANSLLTYKDIAFILRPNYLSWAKQRSMRRSVYCEDNQYVATESTSVHSNLSKKLLQDMIKKSKTDNAKSGRETLKQHCLLFINFKFVIYFISTVLWNFSAVIFITFGPELIVSKGRSKYDAAMLYAFFGVGQLIGCIFFSILGSCIEKRVCMYIISNLLTGAIIGITPLYKSYYWMVMTCLGSGLAYGGILGLIVIVIVDIVGVEDMEIGLGYIMLASGIGCFAGPPICGSLKEVYHDYDYSFYLAGVVGITAGICMLFIYLK